MKIMLLQLHNNNKYYNKKIICNYKNINYFRFRCDLESQTEDLPPPCYNTPVITDIKTTVESAMLGFGGDGGGRTGSDVGRELSGERATLGSGGDGGGRTGSNCGGYG